MRLLIGNQEDDVAIGITESQAIGVIPGSLQHWQRLAFDLP